MNSENTHPALVMQEAASAFQDAIAAYRTGMATILAESPTGMPDPNAPYSALSTDIHLSTENDDYPVIEIGRSILARPSARQLRENLENAHDALRQAAAGCVALDGHIEPYDYEADC